MYRSNKRKEYNMENRVPL